MYTIEKNGKKAGWTGTLHDCLYNIAHQMTSHNNWKNLTIAQAYASGYRIVRVA